MRAISIRSLVAVFCFVQKIIAQSNSSGFCSFNDVFDNGFNASGTVAYPGPRLNDSYPESTWTWTRYVDHYYNTTSNETSVSAAVDLKTTPSLNLSDPNTLPYSGCFFALAGVLDNKRNAEDDGTCNTVLSSNCVKRILKTVNDTVQSLAGSNRGNASNFSCDDLVDNLPRGKDSSCKGKWIGYHSSRFLSDSSIAMNTTQGVRDCPSIDKNADPTAKNVYITWNSLEVGENFTNFDKALRNPLPMIIATWLKEDSTVALRMGLEERKHVADVKLICIPANITTPGSRTLAEALKSGATASFAGGSGGMVGFILWGLVFGWVL